MLKAAAGRPSVARILARRGCARVLVLCYHDLRRDDDFPSWLRVSRTTFVTQLRQLSRVGAFVGLDDLLQSERLRQNRLHFLVTFDDGYRNNCALATELLDGMGIPAVFFVSTSHTVSGEPFWWDEVVAPIQTLRISELDLRAFGLARYTIRQRDPGRWADINRILCDMKMRGNQDQPENVGLLRYLREEYGEHVYERLREYAPLTANDIRRMASSPLVEFGSHGHEHNIMVYLDDDAVRRSLCVSSEILAAHTGRAPRALAYPNGDYTSHLIHLAHEAGFAAAFGTKPGLADIRRCALSIPRLLVSGYETAQDVLFNVNRILLGN